MSLSKSFLYAVVWVFLATGCLWTANAIPHQPIPPGCQTPCAQIVPVLNGHQIVVTDENGEVFKTIDLDLPVGTTTEHIAYMNAEFASGTRYGDGKLPGGFVSYKSTEAPGNSGQSAQASVVVYETQTEIITITITYTYDAEGNLINVTCKESRTKKPTTIQK